MKKHISIFLALSLFCSTAQAAVSFDGGGSADDILSCTATDDILTENGAMTVSVWIYYRGPGEASLGRVFQRTTGSQTVQLLINSGPTLEFQVIGSTNLLRACSLSGRLTTNAWTHFAMTWDGSTTAANVHFYFNGVEASAYSTTQNGVSPGNNSSGTTYIGSNSAVTRVFDGVFDDFAVWSVVLTTADLNNLYNSRLKGMALQVGTYPKRYYTLNEQPVGTASNITYKDQGSTRANCTGAGSPTGSAGILSYPPTSTGVITT